VTHGNTVHGYTSRHKPLPRTYNSWSNMLQRCQNPQHPRYKDYSGRGIEVCGNWQIFKGFLNDMGECPPNKTLDRIDNDGNYCKENCRWASYEENASNKRIYKNNTSGCKGVNYVRGLWIVTVSVSGKRIRLGSSHSLDEAIKIRQAHDLQT
jgi:hypothetical protein